MEKVPAILLGRLAVRASLQGQGFGSALLMDALKRSEGIADGLGVRAVVVDAIDHAVRNFYLKHGFDPLLDDPNHLFLPIARIRQVLAAV